MTNNGLTTCEIETAPVKKQGSNTQVRLLPDLDGTEFVDAKIVGTRFPLHFHDTFVIQFVRGGTDWCCGTDLSASRGQVFIHDPHAPHTGGPVDGTLLRYQAIYPRASLLRELTGVEPGQVCSGSTTVLSQPRFVNRVRALMEECQRNTRAPNAGLRLRSELTAVFELLLESRSSAADNSAATPIYQKMLKARQYLRENFDRDVTNLELGSTCGVSPYHLIRSFKNHFGITPRQFLISQRVVHAKRLIASGETVASAAHACGFADQSHLCRFFKRLTGYAPSHMR
ncbi:MAG: helix-turn-helix domain-containing protein [Planctomycetaceae bacterium]